MATKKVKLFIVEGPSEETAFALIFQRLFSNDSVWFDVVHGDVTTNLSGKPARDAVRDQVIEHVAKQQAYNWTDVAEIVHIVDIDGAFVPDEAVVEVSDEEGLVYYEDHIKARNRTHIIKRNHEKAAALRQLCLNSKITYKRRSVPYKVYYLSRNMEHALYSKIGNLTDRQKENLAREFQRKYRDDLEGFVAFMRDEVGIEGDYVQTWQHLQKETNSLKRGSNMHLFLPASVDKPKI